MEGTVKTVVGPCVIYMYLARSRASLIWRCCNSWIASKIHCCSLRNFVPVVELSSYVLLSETVLLFFYDVAQVVIIHEMI